MLAIALVIAIILYFLLVIALIALGIIFFCSIGWLIFLFFKLIYNLFMSSLGFQTKESSILKKEKRKELQIFEQKGKYPTSYLEHVFRLQDLYDEQISTTSSLKKWEDSLQQTQRAIEASDEKYQVDILNRQKECINKEIKYCNKVLEVNKLYISKVKKVLMQFDVEKQININNKQIKQAQESQTKLFMEKDINKFQYQRILQELKTNLNLQDVEDEHYPTLAQTEQKMDSITLVESLLE